MKIRRGDIWYIDKFKTTGSEQQPGRPAIIVSNNENNEHSATVEVVYLTTQPKTDLPTHVSIHSCSVDSIALCEQVTTVAKERIGDYKGVITDAEMQNLEIAMLISLDMALPDEKQVSEFLANSDNNEEIERQLWETEQQLRDTETQLSVLQQMYDALLSKVIRV